jgi:hypothetical protein
MGQQIVLGLLLGFLACGSAVADATKATHNAAAGKRHVHPIRAEFDAKSASTSPASSSLMTAHGGPVMTQTAIRLIYAGPSWSNPTLVGDKITGLDTFLGGYGNSPYSNTAAEYAGSNGAVGPTVTYQGHGAPLPTSINGDSTTDVVNAVCSEYRANAASMPNPQSELIFVMSDMKRPSTATYCAYHSATVCSGQPLQFGFFWNLDSDPGCNPNDTSGQHSQGLAALANVMAHEIQEARTDPQLNAWFDGSNAEIGDKCAWMFGPKPVTLSNGSQWKLQGEWSNNASNQSSGFSYAPGCIDAAQVAGATPQITNSVSCAPIGAGALETCTGSFTLTAKGGPITLSTTPVSSSNTTGDFQIPAGSCTAGLALASGASCSLGAIQFSPTAVGARTTSVTINTVANGSVSSTITATGQAGTVSVSPASLSCGSVAVGASVTCGTTGITVTAKAGPVTLAGVPFVNSDAADFSVAAGACTPGKVLSLGQSCASGPVTFAPGTTGGKYSVLTVQASVGGAASINLSGTATGTNPPPGKPVLTAGSTVACPATGVGLSAACAGTLTVTASGGPLTLGAVPLALSNATEFSVASGTCLSNVVLNANQSCTLGTVTFKPSAPGQRSTLVTLSTSNGTATTSVAGSGVAGTLTASPASLSCGSAAVGTTASCATPAVTLTASGGTVTLAAGTATGATPFTNSNSVEFTVPAGGCTSGLVLSPGQSCTSGAITFKPSATGARTATLSTQGPSGPVTVALTATGTTPPVVVGKPVLSSPSAVNCPLVLPGSNAPCSGTLTLTASGGTLTLGATPVVVGNPAEFTFVGATCTPNLTLAANSSCTLGTVTFAPNGLGPRSTLVTVYATGGASVAATLAANAGTGTYSATPTKIGCGTVQIGTSASCQAPAISVAALSGSITLGSVPFLNSNAGEFPLNNGTCVPGTVLKAGQACSSGPLTFKPSSSGPRAATVILQTNSGSATISLSGSGSNVPTPPGTPVFTNQVQCPTVGVGLTAACPGALTLTAAGGPLTLGATTITGANAVAAPMSDFTLSGGTCTPNSVLAANATCSFGALSFTPGDVGPRVAMLTIATNSGPASTPLIGLGQPGYVSASVQTVTCGPTPVGKAAPCGSTGVTLTANGGPVVLTAQPFMFADPRDFSIAYGACTPGLVLAPGKSCTTGPVTFTPAGPGAIAAPVYVQATYSATMFWVTGTASSTARADTEEGGVEHFRDAVGEGRR